MSKRIYIVGLYGNMASRYASILRYMGHDVCGRDSFDHNFGDKEDRESADGFIVATPTHTHVTEVLSLLQYNKPILCEKPLTKEPAELEALKEKSHLITMVNQYRFLINEPNSEGPTFYNYFKTGNDGLHWDCLNVIGLSKTRPLLCKTSPLWQCFINGEQISHAKMDSAYIAMIESWLSGAPSNFDYALEAHRKVLEWFPS